MKRKQRLRDLEEMSELAKVDEAITKADSKWCSSLEALGLESQDSERLSKKKEDTKYG